MSWHKVILKSEVAKGEITQVTVNQLTIALYNLDGKIYATANMCTHAPACLAEGFVEDDLIECPRHMGSFHIPTGNPVAQPAEVPLRTYKVREEGEDVYVQIPDQEITP